jgi:protein TonB
MDFAQDGKAGSRTTAFILVVGIHFLMIWAIVSGLATKIVKKIAEPIETKVIEEVKPPPPPDTPPPPPPDLKAPPPPFVPIPEVAIQTATPPPPITIQSQQAAPPQEFKPAPPPAPVVAPPPPRPAGPIQAKVVCTKMPLPEISVDFDSPGEFEYTLTLKNGRVAAAQVKVIRGVPDRRAQRAIIQALDAAVRQYECGSYEGEVTQPFLVKPSE